MCNSDSLNLALFCWIQDIFPCSMCLPCTGNAVPPVDVVKVNPLYIYTYISICIRVCVCCFGKIIHLFIFLYWFLPKIALSYHREASYKQKSKWFLLKSSTVTLGLWMLSLLTYFSNPSKLFLFHLLYVSTLRPHLSKISISIYSSLSSKRVSRLHFLYALEGQEVRL